MNIFGALLNAAQPRARASAVAAPGYINATELQAAEAPSGGLMVVGGLLGTVVLVAMVVGVYKLETSPESRSYRNQRRVERNHRR